MPAIPLKNRIAVALTPDDIQTFQDGVKLIQSVTDKLVDLGDADRRGYQQIGDGGVTWANDAVNFMQDNPALKPAYLDDEGFVQDLSTMGTVRGMQQPLQLAMDRLSDTFLVCSNQANSAALVFFAAVKTGARCNLPNAASVAAAMSANYPRKQRSRAKRSVAPPPAGSPSTNGASPAEAAGS